MAGDEKQGQCFTKIFPGLSFRISLAANVKYRAGGHEPLSSSLYLCRKMQAEMDGNCFHVDIFSITKRESQFSHKQEQGGNLERLTPRYLWWVRAELNCRHSDFQSDALPTELPTLEIMMSGLGAFL